MSASQLQFPTDFNQPINDYLEHNPVDFIDFGASKGGSIEFAKRYFTKDGNGIGLDIDESKLMQMNSMGYTCFYADITKLKLSRKVSFVVMLHFLEHLSGYTDMYYAIESAVKNVKDFVYIHQPFFDCDGYLAQNGLKLYWSDWRGHTNHASSIQFHRILDDLMRGNFLHRYAIYGYDRIHDSDSTMIHPIDSPIDQQHYNPAVHGDKPYLRFADEIRVYREIRVLATRSANQDFAALEQKFQWADKIFDSTISSAIA